MDCRLLLMTGKDYPVPECQLVLHQPTIEEISMVGEEEFFVGIQMLTLNKMMFDVGESVLSDTNNFQIFMTIINQKETVNKKIAVQQVLTLLLPNKTFSFTPRSLIINDGEIKTIDENNFEAFQKAISAIFCLDGKGNEADFNPTNDKAKEIADKIMKGRKKVAAEKGENTGSVFTTYLSILSIGLHIPITELKKYTIFMIYDSMQRFGSWIEYDLDIRSRLAGAQPKTQVENWMKNMY